MFVRKVSVVLFLVATLSSCSSSDDSFTITPSVNKEFPSGTVEDVIDAELVQSQEIASKVVGLPISEATNYVESFDGRSVRIVREDSESYAVTMDYSVTRINIEVDKGIVSKAFVG